MAGWCTASADCATTALVSSAGGHMHSGRNLREYLSWSAAMLQKGVQLPPLCAAITALMTPHQVDRIARCAAAASAIRRRPHPFDSCA